MKDRLSLLGRSAKEVFPPLLAAGYEQQDEVVFSGGRVFRDKLEMITNPDGSTGWYLTQKLPILDGLGRVIALAASSADLKRPTARDPRLAALAGAVETIRRDFAKPLRIESLARSASMSLSQFERKLQNVLHISPRRLLTQARVEAAAKSLRDSGQSLTAIASGCGFYDQAQFCRQFRDATGLTPSRYRALFASRTTRGAARP